MLSQGHSRRLSVLHEPIVSIFQIRFVPKEDWCAPFEMEEGDFPVVSFGPNAHLKEPFRKSPSLGRLHKAGLCFFGEESSLRRSCSRKLEHLSVYSSHRRIAAVRVEMSLVSHSMERTARLASMQQSRIVSSQLIHRMALLPPRQPGMHQSVCLFQDQRRVIMVMAFVQLGQMLRCVSIVQL